MKVKKIYIVLILMLLLINSVYANEIQCMPPFKIAQDDGCDVLKLKYIDDNIYECANKIYYVDCDSQYYYIKNEYGFIEKIINVNDSIDLNKKVIMDRYESALDEINKDRWFVIILSFILIGLLIKRQIDEHKLNQLRFRAMSKYPPKEK